MFNDGARRMVTVKEKIEKWLKDAPEEMRIIRVEVDPLTDSKQIVNSMMPLITTFGYEGNIIFKCNKYNSGRKDYFSLTA